MSSESSTHLSLSLSGVCVCQPVCLYHRTYLIYPSKCFIPALSSKFLPTISIAPAPGPHVSVLLSSCNGCNSSTLSRYFTYSSAIAVDDSAKMSFRNKMSKTSCKLVVQDAAAYIILYLSNVYISTL